MRNTITSIGKTLIATAALMAMWSCGDNEPQPQPADGKVEVGFTLKGQYGAPLSTLTAGGQELNGFLPQPIANGTTLWISVTKTADADGNAVVDATPVLKSYRVGGEMLYPCGVDDDGNVTTTTSTPLYLDYGTYSIKALGPARKLIDNQSLNIDNGQTVIANDERYSQTACIKGLKITPTSEKVQRVALNPLINQTARLKFTLYCDANDPYIHHLKMMAEGVEIDGLQNHYSKGTVGGEAWNWTLCNLADTLVAYPGRKQTVFTVNTVDDSDANKLVTETSILPTDAWMSPLIVLFNVRVNGNPTQLQVMLNQKMFRAGYSYHYRGKVTIENGIAVTNWQAVSWSADIPIL